jgi:hypothetical protein
VNNPVCSKCRVTMKCKKNGVTVAHEDNPNYMIAGDLFSCGFCDSEVLTSTGTYFRREGAVADILITGNS